MLRIPVFLPKTWVAEVRRPPDIPDVHVADPVSPGGILQTLFLKWNPLGKNRPPEEVTPAMVRGWLKFMLIEAPNQQSQRIYLRESMDFGWRILALMTRFGVKVEILPHAEYARRRGVTSSGLYTPQYKKVSLDESHLDMPHTSLVRHEMGHALDHLLSALCLKGHNAGQLLWHGFAYQRKAFVTAYASKNPREYLAESVDAYFQDHAHVWLRENDPGMHAFLKALFELSHH